MIIQCPACATRYAVPDSAIGAEGRTVRCAKCRHSWFQDGPVLVTEVPVAAPVAEPTAPAAPPPPPVVERPVASPPAAAPDPEPDMPAIPPRVAGHTLPPVPEDVGPSAFDAQPPFRPRRNWLKVWTYAAVIFALFAGAIIVAVSYWGLPDWVPVSRPDFAVAEPDLQLDFPIDQQAKRQIAGIEIFEVNGTITNIGSTAHAVPPILVVLRDARGRNVWSKEIVPAKASLGPGESLNVNQVFTDQVPRAARMAEFGWKQQ
jgi:predicted Zn finger-like uncharacterized protein